jgi:hypothetical protein
VKPEEEARSQEGGSGRTYVSVSAGRRLVMADGRQNETRDGLETPKPQTPNPTPRRASTPPAEVHNSPESTAATWQHLERPNRGGSDLMVFTTPSPLALADFLGVPGGDGCVCGSIRSENQLKATR